MAIVTIIGFESALLSAVTGINDLLTLAGASWDKSQQHLPTEKFQVQIASWRKQPILSSNGLSLAPHCAIEEVEHSDVYLVPSTTDDIDQTLAKNAELIKVLSRLNNANAIIGCNSTGAFLLAEAGLLNNKIATTHWQLAKKFKADYPQVDLRPDQLITHDDNILCDGGGLAWYDLGLYIIELFCGHQTAQATAKSFVIDTGRVNQLTYSPLISKKYHQDKIVRNVQEWMELNFHTPVQIADIGRQFAVSNRTLIRRFKEAIQMTPSQYLQEVRINTAIKLLVQTNKTVDEITHLVGYADTSSFIKLFKDKVQYSPTRYRARYKRSI